MSEARNTISFDPPTQRDLAEILAQTGDNKTRSINKAIRFYARSLRAQRNGGEVLTRNSPGSELRSIEFL